MEETEAAARRQSQREGLQKIVNWIMAILVLVSLIFLR